MNLYGNILYVTINPYVFNSEFGKLQNAYFMLPNETIASNKHATPVLNKNILNHNIFLLPTH